MSVLSICLQVSSNTLEVIRLSCVGYNAHVSPDCDPDLESYDATLAGLGMLTFSYFTISYSMFGLHFIIILSKSFTLFASCPLRIPCFAYKKLMLSFISFLSFHSCGFFLPFLGFTSQSCSYFYITLVVLDVSQFYLHSAFLFLFNISSN